jgi:hypothetical protein
MFMTDAEIRSKVREGLKSGKLAKHLPGQLPRTPGQAGNLGAISLGGDQCSVCGGANPHHTYTDPSGQKMSFHDKCQQIWEEERTKPIAN